MISVSLEGLDEAIKAIRGVPSLLDTRTAFNEAGQYLSAIVRDATPPGYTGRLPDSVTYEATVDSLLVGYEQGATTAGDDKYDSLTRRVVLLESALAGPRGQSRSVVRRTWVQRDILSEVLADAVDDSLPGAASVIERSVSRGIS